MCAVIGSILTEPTFSDLLLLRAVFYQSKIRGLHATGISYVKDGKIYTEKSPVCSDEFSIDFSKMLDENKNIFLIGHCRYSTSDLEFNQPISSDGISVSHNGVITQEPPELWERLYGYTCKTKNDSELILRSILDGKSPLGKWQNSSIACCELYLSQKIRFYRNGKRPLYYSTKKNGVIVSSTKDILKRAGVLSDIKMCKANTYYSSDKSLKLVEESENIQAIDLQEQDENSK